MGPQVIEFFPAFRLGFLRREFFAKQFPAAIPFCVTRGPRTSRALADLSHSAPLVQGSVPSIRSSPRLRKCPGLANLSPILLASGLFTSRSIFSLGPGKFQRAYGLYVPHAYHLLYRTQYPSRSSPRPHLLPPASRGHLHPTPSFPAPGSIASGSPRSLSCYSLSHQSLPLLHFVLAHFLRLHFSHTSFSLIPFDRSLIFL